MNPLFARTYSRAVQDANEKRQSRVWLLVIAVFFITLGASLLISRYVIMATIPTDQVYTSPLFDTQTATIIGYISEVKNNVVVIRKDQVEDRFSLASQLTIEKFSSDSDTPTVSHDPATLELQKEAHFELTVVDGKYQIYKVRYTF